MSLQSKLKSIQNSIKKDPLLARERFTEEFIEDILPELSEDDLESEQVRYIYDHLFQGVLPTCSPKFLNTEIVKYRVKAECVDKYVKDYCFLKYLACGDYGCVFQVCEGKEEKEGKNCKYVIKITHVTRKEEIKNAEQEISMTKIASDINIGPKFIATWSCKGEYLLWDKWVDATLFFIVMDKMDITLKEYIYSAPVDFLRNVDKIKAQVKTRIESLHAAGITHNDLHLRNIMLNFEDIGAKDLTITDVKFIDFGAAILDASEHKIERDLDLLEKIEHQRVIEEKEWGTKKK